MIEKYFKNHPLIPPVVLHNKNIKNFSKVLIFFYISCGECCEIIKNTDILSSTQSLKEMSVLQEFTCADMGPIKFQSLRLANSSLKGGTFLLISV